MIVVGHVPEQSKKKRFAICGRMSVVVIVLDSMANGMILAEACIEGKIPKYLKAPDQWLRDIQSDTAEISLEDEKGDKDDL